MHASALYPLRFEPIYQYRPWGGRRLASVFLTPLPIDGPVGEAWLLSDRDDYPSRVADGPLKGKTLRELIAQFPKQFLGLHCERFSRFPVLLKFLDVSERLSVQVHPSDAHTMLIPNGDTGKTEAWIVLKIGPAAHIFAGFKTAVTADSVRKAIANGTIADRLAGFTPRCDQTILIPAGTVHSLSDVVVFEIQQNSDVTFRLYDWDRVDSRTGQKRPLQVEEAIACLDLEQGAINPLIPLVEQWQSALREQLVQCEQFSVTRISGQLPFGVGAEAKPRAVVCLAGRGLLESEGREYPFGKGDALLLPAAVGRCFCRPQGPVSLLEISV